MALRIVFFSSSAMGMIFPCPLRIPFRSSSHSGRQIGDLARQIGGVNQRTTGEGVGPLQTVFQFADVARPVIGQHRFESFVAEHLFLSGGSRHAFQEISDQQREYPAGARAARECAG